MAPVRRLHVFSLFGLAYTGVVFLTNLIPLLRLARHARSIPQLPDSAPAPAATDWPRVSIIVPARNEEQGVRAAVESLLRQDYPALELVVVNDRSTDRTGAILSALAEEHPGRLRVVTVTELPDGWLGKNHALWLGARHSSGAWLLFTDADVIFDPTCLRRAVAYAEAQKLDHLTMSPKLLARGYWLNAFVNFFLYAFAVFARPDLANDPRSQVGVGVGAFNLIRRSAYERIGTHRAISLRPDDDIKLGMRVKLSGLRQRLLNGADVLSVRWYATVGEAIRGLEKNSFAGVEYRVSRVLGAVAILAGTLAAPWALVWIARGWARRLLVATVATQALTYIGANWLNRRPILRYLPSFPFTALLFCYVALRSTWRNLRQGGIRWRDTLYPLAELRTQTGLEGLSGRAHESERGEGHCRGGERQRGSGS
jgi:cellulose synthase/poly-beta-1,6-N-acetylglucosamine synthase-like glycosyltransferase